MTEQMAFDDLALLRNRDHYVYRLWAADGQLLYVGCTTNIVRRRREHARKEWHASVATITSDGPFDRETARLKEAMAILNEQPAYNLAGKGDASRLRISRVLQERIVAGRIEQRLRDAGCSRAHIEAALLSLRGVA